MAMVLLIAISAQANTLTITEPTEYSEFTAGDLISIKVEADFEMKWLSITVQCPGDALLRDVASLSFPSNEQVTFYKTTFDSTGVNNQLCFLSAQAHTKDFDTVFAKTVPLLITPSNIQPNSETAVVVRDAPDTFYPGGAAEVGLGIYAKSEFTGIVLREQIPENTELGLIWSPSPIEYVFEEDTRTLKIVLMDPTAITNTYVKYSLKVPSDTEPGTVLELSGNWEVLGETAETLGKTSMKAAGFTIPECPITDTQLLEFIDKWSKMELAFNEVENDEIIMQIIEVWKGC
jgi:hypothetical protein